MIVLNDFVSFDTLFSDLSGTLIDYKEMPSPFIDGVLKNLHDRLNRFVIVTGQSSDDPQVQRFIRPLSNWPPGYCMLYTSRGGGRWRIDPQGFHADIEYLEAARLTPEEEMEYRKEGAGIIAKMGVPLLIPPVYLDNAVLRFNVAPEYRVHCIKMLQTHFGTAVQISPEGRTSIYVQKNGINKKYAVEYELQQNVSDHIAYAGNEFKNGNDMDVLSIDHIAIITVGENRVHNEAAHFATPQHFLNFLGNAALYMAAY